MEAHMYGTRCSLPGWFQNILFVLDFRVWLWFVSVGADMGYLNSNPLNFLNLEVHFLPHIWEFGSHVSSDKLIELLSFYSFWESHNVMISLHDSIPSGLLHFSSFLKKKIPLTGYFQISVFEFVDSYFWFIKSAIESL